MKPLTHSAGALVQIDGLVKRYYRSRFDREPAFTLRAQLDVAQPQTIGVLGPNGSGKTTLFELITGSNVPTEGRVLVDGRDIHRIRYSERDRLAIHYHQSYQVRAFRKTRPSWMLERAGRSRPLVHLFDEPQFSIQDGYIGFMLDFFHRLRDTGHVVFMCVHPNEPFHIEVLQQSCDRFLFVHQGQVLDFPDFDALTRDARVRAYLGALAPLNQ